MMKNILLTSRIWYSIFAQLPVERYEDVIVAKVSCVFPCCKEFVVVFISAFHHLYYFILNL